MLEFLNLPAILIGLLCGIAVLAWRVRSLQRGKQNQELVRAARKSLRKRQGVRDRVGGAGGQSGLARRSPVPMGGGSGPHVTAIIVIVVVLVFGAVFAYFYHHLA